MPHRVALIKQQNYESKGLLSSTRRAIDLCGFDLSGVRTKRVLLKPNMLGAFPPEMAVTTNPNFVAAVATIFKEAGADVSVGDSPDGVYPVDKTWSATGMREACRKAGVTEARFETGGSVKRDGVLIAKAAFEADLVVNLPKFKTHGLTVMTLAVKNLFGCVVGMQKARIHRKYSYHENFANIVAKIADQIRPQLQIIDGIVAMEGDGPSAGKLTNLNLIIAGADAHAVDAACCRLIGLPPLHLDTLAAAKELGLWDENEPIEFVGDPIDSVRPSSFLLPKTYTRGMRDWYISKLVMKLIWLCASVQPVIDKKVCRRCGLCVKSCPVSAIDEGGDSEAPRICTSKCIQCFCCHETCPHKAIYLKENLGVRLARGLAAVRKHFATRKKMRGTK